MKKIYLNRYIPIFFLLKGITFTLFSILYFITLKCCGYEVIFPILFFIIAVCDFFQGYQNLKYPYLFFDDNHFIKYHLFSRMKKEYKKDLIENVKYKKTFFKKYICFIYNNRKNKINLKCIKKEDINFMKEYFKIIENESI